MLKEKCEVLKAILDGDLQMMHDPDPKPTFTRLAFSAFITALADVTRELATVTVVDD